MKLLIISVVIIIILSQSSSICCYADKGLVVSTCKNTPNYQLCMATFQARPGSVGADITGLSLIMVDAVKAKTKQALAAIDQLRRKSTGGKYGSALQTCTQVYNTVLKYDVTVAVEALTKGNPKFAESAMADAAVEADVCENSFGGVFGHSPLAAVNKGVSDISVVARAVVRNLL